jgi:hypothetical protein
MSRTNTPVHTSVSGRQTPQAVQPAQQAAAQQRGLPQSASMPPQQQQELVAKLEIQLDAERQSRARTERRLLEFEERAAADKIAADQQHRRRLMEMLLVAGQLHEDRKTEAARDKMAVHNSATPAVVEQLHKTAHNTEVERAMVEALRRQMEAKLSLQRAEAAKEREKVQFYRTMLIRRMRELEKHVRMLSPEHWLLRLPDLADADKPFTSVSQFAVQASPAAKNFDLSHHTAAQIAASPPPPEAAAAAGAASPAAAATPPAPRVVRTIVEKIESAAPV